MSVYPDEKFIKLQYRIGNNTGNLSPQIWQSSANNQSSGLFQMQMILISMRTKCNTNVVFYGKLQNINATNIKCDHSK